jgi:hypothetical protein
VQGNPPLFTPLAQLGADKFRAVIGAYTSYEVGCASRI